MNIPQVINIIRQVLPKHLYLSNLSNPNDGDEGISHIDDYRYYIHDEDNKENMCKYTHRSHQIVTIFYKQIPFILGVKDLIYTYVITTGIAKSFHDFLQEVGGDVELYKELMVLSFGDTAE